MRPSRAGRILGVTHLEARGVVLPRLVHRDEARGTRKIIDDPFGDVTFLDQLLGPLDVLAGRVPVAEKGARLVLAHLEVDVGRLDSVAAEHLAEVEGDALAAEQAAADVVVVRGGADEGEVVVCVLQLSVVGVDLVYQERNRFAVFVALDGPS